LRKTNDCWDLWGNQAGEKKKKRGMAIKEKYKIRSIDAEQFA
jgi:hypothetical protein